VAEQLIELSRRYSLLSSRTSFVAIERREVKTDQPAELRRIPVALTQGWGGVQGVRGRAPARLPASAQALLARATVGGAVAGAFESAMRAVAPRSPRKRKAAPALSRVDAMACFDDGFAEEACDVCEERPVAVHLDLLMTQGADGAFGLTEDLARLAGADIDAIADIARSLDAERAEDVVATVLALRLLRALEPDRRDEWIRAARKAARWLASKVGAERIDGEAATDWIARRLERIAPAIARA